MLSFPAYVVVAAGVDRPWLDRQLGDGDFARPTSPPFLSALEERLGVRAGSLDAMLIATPLAGDPEIALAPAGDAAVPGVRAPAPRLRHSRVARAHRYRSDIRVWTGEHGILVLGRGLAGRWEAAFEVDETGRGRGYGRALAIAARHLVPEGRPVWAQCPPGNAASLRALLAAGYIPVGSEVLLIPPDPHPDDPPGRA